MEYKKHLYLIVHPNHALVASHLEPEKFAKHYTIGSSRYFDSRLIFADIDPDFRNDYFSIDKCFSELIPHEDGSPKATKFISNYRTLEFMDFDYINSLFYCNSSGDFVKMEAKEYSTSEIDEELRIILEINPIKMTVLTKHSFCDYAPFITDPNSTKGAPVMFYTQLDFTVDNFLDDLQENPFIRSYIPGIHPSRLKEAVNEVHAMQGKTTKGLSLDCPLDKVPYKHLKHGFMFASRTKTKFFPLIPLKELETTYYDFWKNM